MRIDCGPGYRVYSVRQGAAVYLLLTGGDKSTQERDIEQAKAMAYKLKQGVTHDDKVDVDGCFQKA